MRSVQIPFELFCQLLQYHLMENYNLENSIKQGLEKKLDALVMHELYGKSKSAATLEEREKARQESYHDLWMVFFKCPFRIDGQTVTKPVYFS